jgi:hypothetical protein
MIETDIAFGGVSLTSQDQWPLAGLPTSLAEELQEKQEQVHERHLLHERDSEDL